MSILVDTGIFYAHHDTTADRHDDAVTAFDRLLDGEYGQPYTTDYVLDEAVTLTRVRTGAFDAADTVARRILGENPYPDVLERITVGNEDVQAAIDVFRQYDDHDLSFTDATTLAVTERHGIDAVLSFDSDFDGLVDRVDVTG